jgi:hypothetical protein
MLGGHGGDHGDAGAAEYDVFVVNQPGSRNGHDFFLGVVQRGAPFIQPLSSGSMTLIFSVGLIYGHLHFVRHLSFGRY